MSVVVRNASALLKTKVISVGANGVEVTVKYADNRAVLARQNLFDKVRYITEGAEGRTVTERSFPMGDLRIETVMLVAQSWNLAPSETSAPFPITHNNVVGLLDTDELEQLYDEVIRMNPVWGGEGDSGEA